MSTQTPTKTRECDDCGTEYEYEACYTHHPSRCDDCEEQRQIDRLRACTDPTHDGTFSRASALMRLKNEYDQMPIVDYDGSLIQSLIVEYHPEGSGPYVEKIEKITDCPECGYDKAYTSWQSNAGHHTVRVYDCPSCGHYENNA